MSEHGRRGRFQLEYFKLKVIPPSFHFALPPDLSPSLSIQFFVVASPFSLLMLRRGRQEEIWYLVSHKRRGPSYHERHAAVSFYMYRDTRSIVTVNEAPKSPTLIQTHNGGTSLV